MAAARAGNAAAVRLLLDRGADPNAREESLGETALMWAAAENHPEAVKLLVARGADVNARSNDYHLGEGSVRPRRRAHDPAARAAGRR